MVPQTRSAPHLEHVRCILLRTYETAEGLVAVWISKREVVAYVEVLTISVWQSEGALRRFIQDNGPVATEDQGVISLEPHTFELLYSLPADRRPESLN